jgi:hypothetical protein
MKCRGGCLHAKNLATPSVRGFATKLSDRKKRGVDFCVILFYCGSASSIPTALTELPDELKVRCFKNAFTSEIIASLFRKGGAEEKKNPKLALH